MRALVASFFSLLLPVCAYAQDYTWLTTTIVEIRYAVGITVPVLLGVAVLFFVAGLVRYLLNADDDDARETGRRHMLWGVLALFVIVTVWSIVLLLVELTGVTMGQQYDAPGVDNGVWANF